MKSGLICIRSSMFFWGFFFIVLHWVCAGAPACDCLNEFTYLISRKSFKRPRRSSDNELFQMRTSKGCNSAIGGQIKKR